MGNSGSNEHSISDQPALVWMTWRATVLLTLAVLAVRVAYLVLLCGYELFGDEAMYWESGRHWELCYYEKGPGNPYLIALSTRLFGACEWAVRLPVAVVSALATLVLARLAMASSNGDQRVGFVAALMFTLMPAYQGCAQICTPDGLLIACWILAGWAAWALFVRLESGRPATISWLVVGVVLGLGLLCKQSMLLFVPGLVLYALLRRRHIHWNGRLVRDLTLSVIMFLVVSSPVLIWNHQNGWPSFVHVLGHLGAPGGDRSDEGSYTPLWTLTLIVAQIGAFGPAAIVLMVLAVMRNIRARQQQPRLWPAQLLMICCAVPSLVLYSVVTCWKKAEANWPFPAFATLLVLVAQLAVIELPRHSRLVVEWLRDPRRPRPRRGVLRRRPETLFQVAWDWVVIYGIIAWLLFSFLPNLVAGWEWDVSKRFTGHRAKAARVHDLRQSAESQTGQAPFLVAAHYMEAALYAFYLPDHPAVYNAAHLMGQRKSSYDFWRDTDLNDEALRGRPALLLGNKLQRWEQALRFDSLECLSESPPVYLGYGYDSPQNQ